MRAKEFAKELLEVEDATEIFKLFIKKCTDMQTELLETRYKKINYGNYMSTFKEVDSWQKSVVSNLLKLDKDNRFKDFSQIWKNITNESLEDQGFNFRV